MSTVIQPISETFDTVAAKLVENGYLPIPVPFGKKGGGVSGWQNYRIADGDLDRFKGWGVGILTAQTPGIDIDVRDQVHVDALNALIKPRWSDDIARMIGASPVRIGAAPKMLRLFQLDGAPFAKLVTRGYVLPGDDTAAPGYQPHKVEILGDGQQFAAFNQHQDTGKPYTWTTGAVNPLHLHRDYLPLLSYADAVAYIKAADEYLASVGTLYDPNAELETGAAAPPSDLARAVKIAEARAVWSSELGKLTAAITAVDPDCDRKTWIKVGAALHLASEGAEEGFDLFHRWSSGELRGSASDQYAKEGGGESGCRGRWSSYKHRGKVLASLGTIFKLAIEAGWSETVPPPPVAFVPGNSAGPPPPPGSAPPPPPADTSYTRIDHTGQGNANLLVKLAGGNLRYVAETDQWLRWTNERWEVDTHESFVTGHALQVSKHYLEKGERYEAAGQSEGKGLDLITAEDFYKYATKCRNKTAIDEMIALARKIPGVAISVQDLDSKRHLLGVANGVVNLRTGKLQPDAREDYVTKRSPYAFRQDAAAPRFLVLIEEVTGYPIPADRNAAGEVIEASVGRYTARPLLAAYLVRVLGYGTTGEIKEHKFFIFTGIGSNGKNVILDVVRKVLGPYAQEVPSELLLARAQKSAQDAERPTPVVAGLKGVRMAVFSETTDGQKLDQGVIKRHVGQDTVRARGMRENGGEQPITHKGIMATNHLPALDQLEPAIRDRIASVPFDRRWNRPGIVDRDPALPDADAGLADYLLEHEAEGILAALVRAAVEYYAQGLKPPREVVATTTDYFNANDALGHWISAGMERCSPTPSGTMAADLFKMFSDWCGEQGRELEPSNQTALGIKLGKRGYESKRSNRGWIWGLRKKVPPPPSA